MTVANSPRTDSAKRALQIRAALLSIVGLALLIGLIWFVNPTRILHVLHDAESGWIVFAAAVILISTLLGAANSYLMAAPGPALGFKRFLCAYWVAWAF